MALQTKGGVLLVLALLWSCATTEARLGEIPSEPRLLPAADASPALEGGVETAMCIATACPEPYTTCASSFGPTYKCAVDPRRDPKHCGACGRECPTFEPLHMSSRCVSGRCELECSSMPRYVFPDGERPTNYKNCNGLLDDGCEADLFVDPSNCGACGNRCARGQACVDGQCGCQNGTDACFGKCVDLANDDANCGACQNDCQTPAAVCNPVPAHTKYGCVARRCGKLKCEYSYADCNVDLDRGCGSDGCETSLLDPNHCGRCGKVCKSGEECRDEFSVIDCRPACANVGKVTCPNGACFDTLNDPDNCGGCGLRCPIVGARQQRSCSKGVCVVDCIAGFGDCNGDPTDGCETDLSAHPSNCGACGVSCDLTREQPCIEGKCLVEPCNGSEGR